MQWFYDLLFAFIGGFARIFIASFIIWMIGLIVLLFIELYSNKEFSFQVYMRKIWNNLLFAFQISAYGSIVVGPILIFTSKEYLNYSLLTFDAIILSLLYINLRRRIGSMQTNENKHETDK